MAVVAKFGAVEFVPGYSVCEESRQAACEPDIAMGAKHSSLQPRTVTCCGALKEDAEV